jgi:SAM-dependent methyltransferase
LRQSVLELREFYASPLGAVARRMVSRKIVEAWGDGAELDVLALGYATPFMDALESRARRVVAGMPASQGVEAWPLGAPNRTFLSEETALPLGNAMFERILAMHVLEESDDPAAALDEIHRVLAPSGRVIVGVAARHGLWAGSETSPFGHGRPFSRGQLERLVRDADLAPLSWTRALYAPPLAWTARWADAFEQVGARACPPFAGVILMEAVKQTWAVTPIPSARRVAARARARPVFAPAPVGGRSILD